VGDGIENRIRRDAPMDKNPYNLPPVELKKVSTVCASLDEALAALDKSRAVLTKGGVSFAEQLNSENQIATLASSLQKGPVVDSEMQCAPSMTILSNKAAISRRSSCAYWSEGAIP
jgi:hypothetical protein